MLSKWRVIMAMAVVALLVHGARASVIVADVNGPTSYSIQEIIDAGGLRVGNVVFTDFRFTPSSTSGGSGPNAGGVEVTGVLIAGEYGMRFNGSWSAFGGGSADTTLGFRATADEPWLLHDNSLWMSAYGASGGGLVQITENVFRTDPMVDPTPGIANKYVYYLDDENNQIYEHKDFVDPSTGGPLALAEIWVVKDIGLTSQGEGSTVALSEFYQTFSEIPEPGTLSLLALGSLLAVFRRGRRNGTRTARAGTRTTRHGGKTMARFSILITGLALLLCSGFAQADLSPTAEFIKTRPYMELSTKNAISPILPGEIEKASGIVASVANGLVAWSDGRGGEKVIMGFDLTNPAGGEFFISVPRDSWQEGNPFVGRHSPAASRYVVYDTANTGVAAGDPGDIEGSNLTLNSALATPALTQRSPVVTNASAQDYVCWIDDPGTASSFPGHNNTEIYAAPFPSPFATPLASAANITNNPAPRDSLAASGNYLVWQELRSVGSFPAQTTSWDIAVYDFSSPGVSYIDGPTAGNNQITPDVAGNLVVWTEVEAFDTEGNPDTTNIYFQDLTSAAGPVAITTSGAAAEPAISKTAANNFVLNGDNDNHVAVENSAAPTSYFVVWQDHAGDSSKSVYKGGTGHDVEDYNWDIWGQEIRFDAGKGEWDLYKDPFDILDAVAAGRQTLPDIGGLDVVWQSQDPLSSDIYVWGPVPEPSSLILLACGGLGMLRKRRRTSRRG